MAKDDHLLNLGLHETHWGTCKGKTQQGKPCRHQVIYANGYCAQHGGVTSDKDKAEQLKIAKAKLQRRFKRANKKWPERRSETCSPTGPATRSTSTGNPAVAVKPFFVDRAISAATGTEATASKLSLKLKRASERLTQDSPDPKPLKAGKQSSPTLRKAGEDHRTKQETNLGNGSESRNHKDRENGKEHHPREGEGNSARASDGVALTGYSRGNRGDPWRVVGQDKLGNVLVEIPPWSGWSVPRGVFDPRATDWQEKTCPPRALVEPKTFDD